MEHALHAAEYNVGHADAAQECTLTRGTHVSRAARPHRSGIPSVTPPHVRSTATRTDIRAPRDTTHMPVIQPGHLSHPRARPPANGERDTPLCGPSARGLVSPRPIISRWPDAPLSSPRVSPPPSEENVVSKTRLLLLAWRSRAELSRSKRSLVAASCRSTGVGHLLSISSAEQAAR